MPTLILVSYLTDRLARWPAIEQACLYLWPMTERITGRMYIFAESTPV